MYNLVIKVVFYAGISFFWFLIYCLMWMEYCPPFVCDPFDDVRDVYDYIIVGAGTAGCVVSLRLAGDRNVSVLLVEAGPTGGKVLDIPAGLPMLQLSPLDWNYKTVPQKNALKAMTDHVGNWPRGKLVGGTGRFNNMLYVRGHRSDYDAWFANKSDYDYERDVLAYFKRSERQRGRYRGDGKHHGTTGYLYVDDLPFLTDLGTALLEAVERLGYPVRDVNGAENTGFTVPQVNVVDGARYSTGHHLLDHKPDNLKLQTNTLVERVLFKNDFEAYAVRASKYGVRKTIRARKGVVLCAGTIDTPKLLMLSGIGPRRHLGDVGIRTIVDLPVGENLQDHIAAGTDLYKLKTPLALNPLSLISPYTIYDYVYNGKGPWTSVQCEFLGQLHTDCIGAERFDECMSTKTPDLQVMALPMGIGSDNGAHLWKIIGVSERSWRDYYEHIIGVPTISILPILLHPKSRGTVKLASSDVADKPIIDPNYLSERDDLDVLLKGVEFAKSLGASPSLRKLGVEINRRPYPGCEQYEFDTDVYWECYVRHITMTVYHPVGTAKMGPPDDPSSVVDYEYKVLGVEGLYVADASVFPTLTSGNTNAPVVLVAELAADSIKRRGFLSRGRSRKIDVFTPTRMCSI